MFDHATGRKPSEEDTMTLMTAQFAGSPAAARRRPATIRLTRRGRLLLRGIPVMAAAAAATLAVAFLLGVLLSPAAVSADTAAPATQTVTVMPGDSLWTIATTVAPEEDVYEVIAAIDELNGLEGRAPTLGEELFIPATR